MSRKPPRMGRSTKVLTALGLVALGTAGALVLVQPGPAPSHDSPPGDRPTDRTAVASAPAEEERHRGTRPRGHAEYVDYALSCTPERDLGVRITVSRGRVHTATAVWEAPDWNRRVEVSLNGDGSRWTTTLHGVPTGTTVLLNTTVKGPKGAHSTREDVSRYC